METSPAAPATVCSLAPRRVLAATLVVLAAAFLLALCAAQPAHAVDAKGKWDACDWEIKGDTFTVTASSGGNAIKNSPESIPWERYVDKADMTGVKRIVIGTKENSVKLEGSSANRLFDGLSKVESIDLSHFDISGVEDIGGLFYDCSSLTSLDLSGFDTSQVTSMSNMFNRCGALTSLDLSGFDTSQVMNMDNMFNLCVSLTSLDLSGFDTSQVTSMSEMFYGCKALTSLDLSSFDTSQVTSMSGMFNYCEKLASLNLSTFDTSNETSKTNMFSNTSLFAVRLSEKFKGSFALPYNHGKAIVDTGLSATSQWLDPDGHAHGRSALDPSTMGAGWYLAQPASGSYALFDWDVPAVAPVFVLASGGTAAPPASLDGRAPSNWLNAKGENVGLGAQDVDPNSAAAFSAAWGQLPVTKDQFIVTLPEKGTVYNGNAQKALVKPKDSFVGKVTKVLYAKDGAPATTEPPKDAGTYQVSFECEEGAGYLASDGPIPCGDFTIEQRVLNDKVRSSVVIQVYQGEPYKSKSVAIQLSGGNIVGGAKLDAVATGLIFPDNKTLGDHYDGSLKVVELKDANYAVPEGGLPINNQQYRVDPKKVPTLNDFQVALPQGLSYDGKAHAAEVTLKQGVEDMGAVTVSYTRTDGEPSAPMTTAPKDAGTYQVALNVAEGYAYTEAVIPASQFTIAKRALSGGEKASLGTVNAGTTQATDVFVVLTGGAILAGEEVQATASTVKYPGGAVAGKYDDAEVTLSPLPSSSNYTLPNEGLVLRDQTYTVLKKNPTKDDFDIDLPQGAVYNGEPHAAAVSTAAAGMGTIGEIRYTRQGETSATTTAPKDAGTYRVEFDVAEGAAFARATIDAGAFAIDPLALSGGETAELPAVAAGSTTEPVPDTPIALSGGSILPGDAPLAAKATVEHPATDVAGLLQGATVTDVEPANANYAAGSGYRLENQAYRVSAKLVPTIADFDAQAVEAEYDGEAHEVGVAPRTAGVGEVENVRYLKGGEAVAGGPVDAGTYALVFDVRETATHAAAKNLTVADAVRISPRVLNASMSAALKDIGQGTFSAKDVDVVLSGGRIVGEGTLEARASEVSYPSGGMPGVRSDARVALAALVDAPNYALPEGGLVLEGQSYRVVAVSPAYEVTEGEGSTWEQGSEGGLRFRAEAEFSKFRGVMLDGGLVDPEDYEAESGSTVVTLRPAFLATLAPGEHLVRLLFEDGAAEAAFSVAAPGPKPGPGPDGPQPAPGPGPDNPLAPTGPGGQGGSSGGSDAASALAPTGDPAAPAALALVGLAAASLVGLSVARRRA